MVSSEQRKAMAKAAIAEVGFFLPSPLRDHNVVLLHVPWHFETKSNLTIHHSQTLPPIWGVVLMVGAKVSALQYGDHVRFKRHSGEELCWRGKQYWVHHIDDIECIINDDENPPYAGVAEDYAKEDLA